MGADGWPAAQAFGIERLAAMPRFVRGSAIELGRGHVDRTEEGGLMFTGIVTGIGTVRELTPIGAGADMRLVIGTSPGRTSRAIPSAPRSPAPAAA